MITTTTTTFHIINLPVPFPPHRVSRLVLAFSCIAPFVPSIALLLSFIVSLILKLCGNNYTLLLPRLFVDPVKYV